MSVWAISVIAVVLILVGVLGVVTAQGDAAAQGRQRPKAGHGVGGK